MLFKKESPIHFAWQRFSGICDARLIRSTADRLNRSALYSEFLHERLNNTFLWKIRYHNLGNLNFIFSFDDAAAAVSCGIETV